MEQKCRYCFLISRNDEHIKSLFQSWDKVFQNEYALRNHQKSKYCAKKIKQLEYWKQQEELFARESNHGFPNTTFELAEVYGVPCKSQDKDVRAPYGLLEEFGNENIEDYNSGELEDVMVNLEEEDIFHNKFMYNMINCGKSSAPFTISEYLNDIIENDDEVRLGDLDSFVDRKLRLLIRYVDVYLNLYRNFWLLHTFRFCHV